MPSKKAAKKATNAPAKGAATAKGATAPAKGATTAPAKSATSVPAKGTTVIQSQPNYSFDFVPHAKIDGSKSLFTQLQSTDKSHMSFADYDNMRQEQVFKEFDRDGNGFIDSSELELCFKKLGQNLDKKQLGKQIEMYDENHDGKISLVEFKKLFNKQTGAKTNVAKTEPIKPAVVDKSHLASSTVTQKASIAPIVEKQKTNLKPVKEVAKKEEVKKEDPKKAEVLKKQEIKVNENVKVEKDEEIFDQALYDECFKEAEQQAQQELIQEAVKELIEAHINAQKAMLSKDHVIDAQADIKHVTELNKTLPNEDKKVARTSTSGAGSIFGVQQNATAQLREIFNAFDEDNSGAISGNEIMNVLDKIGTKVTIQQANKMIKDVDVNHDNELDFNEFKDLVKKINAGEYGFIKQDAAKVVSNISYQRESTLDNQDYEDATDIAFGIKPKQRSQTAIKPKVAKDLAESKYVDTDRTLKDQEFEDRIKKIVLQEAEDYIKQSQRVIIARNELLESENRRLQNELNHRDEENQNLQYQIQNYQNVERRLKDENKIKLMQAIQDERNKIQCNRMEAPVQQYVYQAPVVPTYTQYVPQSQVYSPPKFEYKQSIPSPPTYELSVPKFEYIKPESFNQSPSVNHNITLPDYKPAPITSSFNNDQNVSYTTAQAPLPVKFERQEFKSLNVAPAPAQNSFERYQDIGMDAVPGPATIKNDIEITNVEYPQFRHQFSSIGLDNNNFNQDSVESKLINQYSEGKEHFDMTMSRTLCMAVVSQLLSKNTIQTQAYLDNNGRFMRVWNDYDAQFTGRVAKIQMNGFLSSILRS